MTRNEPAAADAAGIAVADAQQSTAADGVAEPQQPMSRSYIFWLMLASFGVSMAMMVPLAYGIAVRISELAPGREEVLGYITGTAQAVYLIISPMIGIWSDRTRSRFGRRTPFIYLGIVIGLLGLVVISFAPNLLIVGAGWVLGMSGWSIAGAPLQLLMADKLPESQRGKVSALTGLMTQIAPVLGIGVAYAVSSNTTLVFLVPGIIGALMLAIFPLIKPEEARSTSRGTTL
ncbi:MFS transporter [Agromyces mangrovi Wang et al. 2018]|uniref:MFS transporter n=1 Tax=Agromyces mangrovi TaxID=1858653 RepID=UPI0025725916|nr:MFS transporter [Agromyces mangrovi]